MTGSSLLTCHLSDYFDQFSQIILLINHPNWVWLSLCFYHYSNKDDQLFRLNWSAHWSLESDLSNRTFIYSIGPVWKRYHLYNLTLIIKIGMTYKIGLIIILIVNNDQSDLPIVCSDRLIWLTINQINLVRLNSGQFSRSDQLVDHLSGQVIWTYRSLQACLSIRS